MTITNKYIQIALLILAVGLSFELSKVIMPTGGVSPITWKHIVLKE